MTRYGDWAPPAPKEDIAFQRPGARKPTPPMTKALKRVVLYHILFCRGYASPFEDAMFAAVLRCRGVHCDIRMNSNKTEQTKQKAKSFSEYIIKTPLWKRNTSLLNTTMCADRTRYGPTPGSLSDENRRFEHLATMAISSGSESWHLFVEGTVCIALAISEPQNFYDFDLPKLRRESTWG